jgi:hypothetical protein
MNVVNRVLAGLLLLATIAAAIVVLLLIGALVDVAHIQQVWPYGPVASIARDITRLGPARRGSVAIGTAIVGLVALLLFVLEFRRQPRRARTLTIHAEGPGYTEIAFGTIEDVVLHTGAEVAGIQQVARARVDQGREGLRIVCRAFVGPGVEMAAAGSQLEQVIVQRVREVTGVSVSSVRVRTETAVAGSSGAGGTRPHGGRRVR